ncbi:hypothetical protein J4E91_011125 [Alternaria rosae]|nr:hypothetical protein J4E91_011125 [Alternaria rosae]
MARQLYVKLQIIFNDIREIAASPIYRTMCEMRIVVEDVALVPSSHYQAVVGAEEQEAAWVCSRKKSVFKEQ